MKRSDLYTKLLNYDEILECYESFDLLMGKIENDCFDLAKKKRIDELVKMINNYYSTRASSQEMNDICAYLKTNIKRVYSKKYDRNIVNEIANLTLNSKSKKQSKFNKQRKRQSRSLASKVMYFVDSDNYPIYDSYARDAMANLNKSMNFYQSNLETIFKKFENKNFFNYDEYKKIIDMFIAKLIKNDRKCSKLTYKEIDKYLWIYGKNI